MSITFGEYIEPGAQISKEATDTGAWIAGAIPAVNAENGGFLEAARWWGYFVGNVFPLSTASSDPDDVHAGKVPHRVLGRDWTSDDVGTRDLTAIQDTWREVPLANIGITTRASGILILDVDPRHDGWANLSAWAKQHDVDLSRVPRSVSPRGDGGAHLWFRLPHGLTYPHSPLVRGVDRPWQVPVPPSMRWVVVDAESRDPSRKNAFRPYVWVAGDPRELPIASEAALVQGVGQSQGNGADSSGDTSSTGPGGAAAGQRIGKVVADGLAVDGVPVGQQSYQFKRVACSMVRRNYSDQQILERLVSTADVSPIGDPSHPWELRELAAIVMHARRYIESEKAREKDADDRNGAFARALWGR